MLKASVLVKALLASEPAAIYPELVDVILKPCSDDDTPDAVCRLLARLGADSTCARPLSEALGDGSYWDLHLAAEVKRVEVRSVVGALAFAQMLRADLLVSDMPDLPYRNVSAIVAAAAQQIRVYYFG